jgi:hypothetical protein
MAKALGYGRIFVDDITTITDDHIPLLGRGLKVVDVVDIAYIESGAHHRVQDTIDKISAEALTIVGRVALALIRAEERKN